MTRGCKILVPLILCFSLLICGCITFVAQGAEFYFEDIEAKRGRLFDITLCAQKCSDVAAFVADITYDADVMEYRDYTLCDDNMQAQVNSSEEGLLRVVFLCENGVDCSKGASLIDFEFKAVKGGECSVNAAITDRVNSDCEDMDAVVKSGLVTVSASSQNAADDSVSVLETSEETEALQTEENENGSSKILPAESSVVSSIIIVVLCILAVLGCIAYKVIEQRKKKEKETGYEK